MDNSPRNPLLNFAYFCHGKSVEELRQSLLLTTLELDSVKTKAQEELRMRDDQLSQLRDVLNRAIRERDDAQDKLQRLLLEKMLLQQQQQQHQHQQQLQLQHLHHHHKDPLSGVSSVEDEPRGGFDSNNGFSSSDSDESIVSSPAIDAIQPPSSQLCHPEKEPDPIPLIVDKLPEKGKFLQAVMKAGPLLQTLLLAGPLPQWRHPPPPLDTYQIPPPPLAIPSPRTPTTATPSSSGHLLHHQELSPNNYEATNSGNNNQIAVRSCGELTKKRGFYDCSDSSTETKYQRIALH